MSNDEIKALFRKVNPDNETHRLVKSAIFCYEFAAFTHFKIVIED